MRGGKQRQLVRPTSVVCTLNTVCRCGSETTNLKRNRMTKEGPKLCRVHEAVRCKNNEWAVSWQREKNTSLNILHLVHCLHADQPRPAYLFRFREEPRALRTCSAEARTVFISVLDQGR